MIRVRREWSNDRGHGALHTYILMCPVCLWDHIAQSTTQEIGRRLLIDHFAQVHPGTEVPSLSDLEEITAEAFSDAKRIVQ
jgi:hypothetical protein